MEDILEELVGDIWDENDEKDVEISSQRKDGSYVIDGGLNLEDFCNLFDLDYDELDTEYVTIGGFIIELLDDKFANVGDIVTYKDVEMEILSVDKNMVIDKLLARKIDKEEEENKDKDEETKKD